MYTTGPRSSLKRHLSVTMCARVAYCVDIDKSVIIGNFEKRGWVSVGPDDDWHFYWASTTTCRNLFAVDSGSFSAKRTSLFVIFVIFGERPQNSRFVSPLILRLHPCPFADGKEATVNRTLDGSTYPGSKLVHSVFGKINYGGLKHNNLYLGLVLPSGGWQRLIKFSPIDLLFNRALFHLALINRFSFVYKYRVLCLNKSVFNCTFCQLLK